MMRRAALTAPGSCDSGTQVSVPLIVLPLFTSATACVTSCRAAHRLRRKRYIKRVIFVHEADARRIAALSAGDIASARRLMDVRQAREFTLGELVGHTYQRRHLVVVFTLTAIAMSASVVVAGSNSWAEAMPLIIFVVVFGLTKVFLANALFYVMIRSDAHFEAVAAATASKAKAAGLVIRRPPKAPGSNQLKIAGARPRRAGPSSNVRLAILPRRGKPTDPPHRTDR